MGSVVLGVESVKAISTLTRAGTSSRQVIAQLVHQFRRHRQRTLANRQQRDAIAAAAPRSVGCSAWRASAEITSPTDLCSRPASPRAAVRTSSSSVGVVRIRTSAASIKHQESAATVAVTICVTSDDALKATHRPRDRLCQLCGGISRFCAESRVAQALHLFLRLHPTPSGDSHVHEAPRPGRFYSH